jgi:hypothetical protein
MRSLAGPAATDSPNSFNAAFLCLGRFFRPRMAAMLDVFVAAHSGTPLTIWLVHYQNNHANIGKSAESFDRQSILP